MVPATGNRGIIIGIGIVHGRDELILQTLFRALFTLVMLSNSCVVCWSKLNVSLKGGDGMMRRGSRLELIRGVTTECQQLEETGPVHLVRIEAEGGAGRKFMSRLLNVGEQYPWKVSVVVKPNS